MNYRALQGIDFIANRLLTGKTMKISLLLARKQIVFHWEKHFAFGNNEMRKTSAFSFRINRVLILPKLKTITAKGAASIETAPGILL